MNIIPEIGEGEPIVEIGAHAGTLTRMTSTADMTMAELLETYPGAQRALFRSYHIGGCASCGFRPDETLAEVCLRNQNLDAEEVLENVRLSWEQDQGMMISPDELKGMRDRDKVEILDIRTREEYETVRLEGSHLLDQNLMQQMLGARPKDQFLVILDHDGSRSLDAAAYFAGHGFTNIKCLRGGIDAWSVQVDPNLPRYTLE
ncbi:MAG TPA: rhodanese-like domain-containing protein [Terrimicrobiaceae bacterium]